MELAAHWDAVYGSKAEDAVSWFQAEAATSLALLRDLSLGADAAVLDVGGGASRLVDALLDVDGFTVTVLDVASQGLERARQRLGGQAEPVAWLVADVTRWQPDRGYQVWHDRAVFHFLVDDADRERYCAVLRRAVMPGGYVIVATFASDGPAECSGLPVCRYDAEELHAQLGSDLERVTERRQLHTTPWGAEQPFTWLVLRRP